MNPFYNCFTRQNNEKSQKSVKIEITKNFTSLIEIFDYFGEKLYHNNLDKNIVMEGTYFGKNLDAFYDCLKTYFFEVNEYVIDVYVCDVPKQIDDKRFYAFLMLLIATRRDFPNFNLNVFLSKTVFEFYFDISFDLMQMHLLDPLPFDESSE